MTQINDEFTHLDISPQKRFALRNPEYEAGRSKVRREKHKQHLIERLGGCCAQCGTTENLEFNHKHPNDKVFPITAFISISLDKLYEEADKCELLCHSCHKIHTSQQKELAWTLLKNLPRDLYDGIMKGEIDPTSIRYETN